MCNLVGAQVVIPMMQNMMPRRVPFREISRPDNHTQHFATDNVQLVHVAHPDYSMARARKACGQKQQWQRVKAELREPVGFRKGDMSSAKRKFNKCHTGWRLWPRACASKNVRKKMWCSAFNSLTMRRYPQALAPFCSSVDVMDLILIFHSHWLNTFQDSPG